ncbi:peptidylprolyl isomerase [Hymenobacter aerilatus]|uniref:Peptidylprolyl isomerase n=1 Tax=Hymenobacter aerilatus TaxID=2932251 RepID=A0A8T9SVM2_9BACT|nr:peptidylprolyl isomerase [Hymenobacter aerilatus]UOR05441.1 peptidylprolyl isomerase [Hymenobacter aerilatus]
MPKRILYAGAALALLAGCQSTKSPSATKQPVVETLGTHPVPASEFAYVYRKNNSTAPDFGTRAGVDEYLKLYTNFKLKVLDAEQRGLDTTQAFRRELDGYRQQLAQPYLTEKSVTDQLVREAYDRLSKEINASHILLRVAPDASPKDTLAAYQKTQALRQRVTSGGENFETVARQTSEDPSARENGGRLGYFTSMQMVYPFESAAYKTPVGQVSEPVRTRFGYHLIKVNDTRAAQGEIKVAHLMIRATPNMPAADSATAKKKIDELYSRLQRGENWDKLVAQFSEDAGSAPNGGEIPAFGAGRMIPSFEEAAFKLQKPGDLSRPVQTPYGWHVIKLIEKMSVPSFEAMQPTLKSKVAKDSRSELNHAAFLKRVKAENKFEENKAGKEYAFSKADTALVNGRFKYSGMQVTKGKGKPAANPTLFTINGKTYPATDFLAYVEQSQRPRPGDEPQHAMQVLYDQYVDQSLTNYERDNLEGKYEDYRMLVKEYRDGILLFQLMDEKVWSKAIDDSVGLQKFFTEHQQNYQWAPRVQATVVNAASPEVLKEVLPLVVDNSKPVTKNGGTGIALGLLPTTKGIPATIGFQPRTATLLPASQPTLEALADQMATDTTLIVSVSGRLRTSAEGTLARKRIQQVRSSLEAKGVQANRIMTGTKVEGNKAKNLDPNAVYLRGATRDLATIEQRFNEKSPLAVKIQQRTFQQGDNKAVDQVWQRGPGTYPVQLDGRYYSVIIKEQLPAGPKKLSETRGQATSDYQNYLEQQWIEQLRAQYPVQLNQQEIDKLVTK